jgi:hypothetical protein
MAGIGGAKRPSYVKFRTGVSRTDSDDPLREMYRHVRSHCRTNPHSDEGRRTKRRGGAALSPSPCGAECPGFLPLILGRGHFCRDAFGLGTVRRIISRARFTDTPLLVPRDRPAVHRAKLPQLVDRA